MLMRTCLVQVRLHTHVIPFFGAFQTTHFAFTRRPYPTTKPDQGHPCLQHEHQSNSKLMRINLVAQTGSKARLAAANFYKLKYNLFEKLARW